MTAPRRAAGIAAAGVAPLVLTTLAAGPAVAHGAMTDPASRSSACFAEGPEHPRSAACKAAVAVGGTQALYDWHEVNLAAAAGRHRQLIPNGKLCSAGRDKYKGLDLPRADWPASQMTAGAHTFRYQATAPHKGTFELYITKDGYDPSRPLKWSDLEAEPFAKVTNPKLVGGEYVFAGIVPNRSGRHLIYSIWQRSDSPEAFYACSDVVFGNGGGSGGAGSAPAATATAPSGEQSSGGSDDSTADRGGHDADQGADAARDGAHAVPVNEPVVNGSANPVPDDRRLAETGNEDLTTPLAIGGAGALAFGAAVLLTSTTTRRKPARAHGRHRA